MGLIARQFLASTVSVQWRKTLQQTKKETKTINKNEYLQLKKGGQMRHKKINPVKSNIVGAKLFNRVKRDAIQLVRSICRANKAKEKRVYLEALLDDFELLKFEIRLCVDMKILSVKKQAELSQLMDSIGKQIVGWRNANPA